MSESGLSKDRDSQKWFEHTGLNTLATPLERPGEKLAKHGNGDTESLPRFRPPCGVIPYSCLSDGLRQGDNSTRARLPWLELLVG